MKFAIISDIHANLEALQSVLADSKEQKCTHYAFLGDFVGYCADPRACIEIVRGMNAPCVKGNHDEYCATDWPLYGWSTIAAMAVHWTRKQLTDADRQWLQSLPYACQVADFTIVHSSLDRPEHWQYVFDDVAAAASFPHQKTQMCFFGHTHVPVAFIRDTVIRGGTFTKLKVEPGKKYFVNPGSAGRPRDRNLNAAYVVYDMNENTVELRRISYDIAATQKKIRDAGLGG